MDSIKKIRHKKVPENIYKKVKLLVTIVNRSKALFFTDLLEGYDVNMQTIVMGKGTSNIAITNYLSLAEKEKAIIFSFINEDNEKEILEVLAEKFKKVRNGKGIAYTIPLSSVIGVFVYQFLINDKTERKEI